MTQPTDKITSRLQELNMDIWRSVLDEMDIDEIMNLIHIAIHTAAQKTPDADEFIAYLRRERDFDGEESYRNLACFHNALVTLAGLIEHTLQEK